MSDERPHDGRLFIIVTFVIAGAIGAVVAFLGITGAIGTGIP